MAANGGSEDPVQDSSDLQGSDDSVQDEPSQQGQQSPSQQQGPGQRPRSDMPEFTGTMMLDGQAFQINGSMLELVSLPIEENGQPIVSLSGALNAEGQTVSITASVPSDATSLTGLSIAMTQPMGSLGTYVGFGELTSQDGTVTVEKASSSQVEIRIEANMGGDGEESVPLSLTATGPLRLVCIQPDSESDGGDSGGGAVGEGVVVEAAACPRLSVLAPTE